MDNAADIDIYTTIAEAKVEIWKRWNDENLRKEVERYVNGVPDFMKREPGAVMWRNVASPTMEYLQFLKLAEQVKLKPVLTEYTQDKFVTRNRDKMALAKMAFSSARDRNGVEIINYKKVIAISAFDGKKFADVETLWGDNFVDFHHGLMNKHSPAKIDMIDISDWIATWRQRHRLLQISTGAFYMLRDIF